jgi:hypothetical protein
MEAEKKLRDATQSLSARMLGTARTQPAFQSGQTDAQTYLEELMKLPNVDAGPVQILNPADGNFGAFIFMAGYSRIGGTDVMYA